MNKIDDQPIMLYTTFEKEIPANITQTSKGIDDLSLKKKSYNYK